MNHTSTFSPAPAYGTGQQPTRPAVGYVTLQVFSASTPPDDDTTVLVMLDGDDEPSWLGYCSASGWKSIDGFEFAGQVVGWIHTPCREDMRFTPASGHADATTPAHHHV